MYGRSWKQGWLVPWVGVPNITNWLQVLSKCSCFGRRGRGKELRATHVIWQYSDTLQKRPEIALETSSDARGVMQSVALLDGA